MNGCDLLNKFNNNSKRLQKMGNLFTRKREEKNQKKKEPFFLFVCQHIIMVV